MNSDNLETEALKLPVAARARLVEKLLESLEQLSPAENDAVWAEEAERRDAAWVGGRPTSDVFSDARARSR